MVPGAAANGGMTVLSPALYVGLLAFVAGMGGLLFGYETAVISGTTEALQAYFQITDLQLGWVAASALAGCVVGVLVAGWFADRFGRKAGMIFSGILFAIASVGAALAPNVDVLILARLIGGVGVGIASMVTPMYIAEISPPRIRGALVSLNQVAIVTGMLFAYLMNRTIVDWGDQAWMTVSGWRWMFGMMLAPSAIFLLLALFVPESPRWLAQKGFFDRARDLIARISAPERAKEAFDGIMQSLSEEEGEISELFRPGARSITFMSMVLALFQAFTGINIVMYYAPRIFLKAGLAASDAYGHSILIALVMIAATIVSLMLVDRVGRRPIILAASAGMGISLLVMGLVFPRGDDAASLAVLPDWVAANQGMILLLGTLSFVSWFSMGMGGIYWVVVSEIFPNRIRGRAMALSVVFLWIGNFLVTQYFPVMLSGLGGDSFYVFAGACLVCFLFVAASVPETKGRSLEAIEADFFRR